MTTGVSVHYKLLGFLRALFRNCTRIKRNAGDIHSAYVCSTCQGRAPRVCTVVLHINRNVAETRIVANRQNRFVKVSKTTKLL